MAVELTMNNTLGVYLLATFAASVLFGITNLQVFLYYRLYPKDSIYLRLAVAFLWVLDALILAFEFHALYHYLILNFGDILAVAYPVWSIRAEGAAVCVMLPFVQSLYAIRVWKLYRPQRIVPVLVTICVAAAWAFGIVVSRKLYFQVTYHYSSNFTFSVISASTALVVGDIATSAALCWRLYQPKHGFSCTGSIIRDIVLWILGTGILTCACSISLLATFLRMPHTLVWIALSAIVPKIAANGFLAMLNVRHSLRAGVAGRALALPKVERTSNSTVQAPLAVHISRNTCMDVIEISVAKDHNSLMNDYVPELSA